VEFADMEAQDVRTSLDHISPQHMVGDLVDLWSHQAGHPTEGRARATVDEYNP
jgi:hypothetical protein